MKESQKYIELVSAFITSREFGPALDLMKGWHPTEKRWLVEEEEYMPLDMLRFVRRKDILNSKNATNITKLAQLWLKYFPELDALLSLNDRDLYSALWKAALRKVDPIHLTYVFYPSGTNDEYHKVRDLANERVERISKLLDNDQKFDDKAYWVFSFPAKGPLGDSIEEKSGLSKKIKNNLGIFDQSPGLLCNFLLNRDISIEQILSPNQFEDLVAMIFKEEGWDVYRMPKTRDGGKDIIAKLRTETSVVAYIQAKRYSKMNKVGISRVKEFVATVAGDEVPKGFLVSTSYFSKPSRNWLHNKGLSLADIQLVNRDNLFERMRNISDSDMPVYLLKD